jgi:hypothetical protein
MTSGMTDPSSANEHTRDPSAYHRIVCLLGEFRHDIRLVCIFSQLFHTDIDNDCNYRYLFEYARFCLYCLNFNCMFDSKKIEYA